MASETRRRNRIYPLAKRLLALLMSFIIMIGAGGCMSTTERQMRAYLSEKYPGQEFITVSISAGGIFNEAPRMTFYPKGGDPVTDTIKVNTHKTYENSDEGEIEFADNYFDILIRADVEADVRDMLSDVHLPMTVYYKQGGGYFREYDSTKTYADLKKAILEETEFGLTDVWIFMLCEDIENRKQYAEQIYDTLLLNSGVVEDAVVYMIADESIYSKITRKNCYDTLKLGDETVFKFFESTATYKGPYSDF